MDQILVPIDPSISKDETHLIAILAFLTENAIEIVRKLCPAYFKFTFSS
jgi:hypothetical protein